MAAHLNILRQQHTETDQSRDGTVQRPHSAKTLVWGAYSRSLCLPVQSLTPHAHFLAPHPSPAVPRLHYRLLTLCPAAY